MPKKLKMLDCFEGVAGNNTRGVLYQFRLKLTIILKVTVELSFIQCL